MIKIHFSDEELPVLKEAMKLLYEKFKHTPLDKVPSLHIDFKKVFAEIWGNTEGFEYMCEGIESDISIALKSKKNSDRNNFLYKALTNMKNDLSDVFEGIFEEKIDDKS